MSSKRFICFLKIIDNKKLLAALTNIENVLKSKDLKLPKVSEYIGECIVKIAQNLSYSGNFSGYTYIDEMVSDGIENCIKYINNFDPEKSKNPFAYLTQIVWYAFVRRINKEKKETEKKRNLVHSMSVGHGVDSYLESHDKDMKYDNSAIGFMSDMYDDKETDKLYNEAEENDDDKDAEDS